jgi:hypothetical protein
MGFQAGIKEKFFRLQRNKSHILLTNGKIILVMGTTSNIKSNDIIDQLIFEKGLRIESVVFINSKVPYSILISLNNTTKIVADISEYLKTILP